MAVGEGVGRRVARRGKVAASVCLCAKGKCEGQGEARRGRRGEGGEGQGAKA